MWQLGSSPSTGKSSWSSHYQEKVSSSLPCWVSSGYPPCPESQTEWGSVSPKEKTTFSSSSLQVITIGNIVSTEKQMKIVKIQLLPEDLPADYFKTEGCHRCWRWTRCVFLTHFKNWRGLYAFIPLLPFCPPFPFFAKILPKEIQSHYRTEKIKSHFESHKARK